MNIEQYLLKYQQVLEYEKCRSILLMMDSIRNYQFSRKNSLLNYCCFGLDTHLFVKVPRPGGSEVTFSVFESSCHLISLSVFSKTQQANCRPTFTLSLFYA